MPYVIQLLGLAGSLPDPATPEEYVKTYDPEAHDGRGDLAAGSLAEALRFPDAGAAFTFIRQQPQSRPLRPDGKPNRPLLAFNLEIRSVPA